jgi:hypothetical protein
MSKSKTLQLRLPAEVVLSIVQESPDRAAVVVLIDYQHQPIKVAHSECAIRPNDFPLFCVPQLQVAASRLLTTDSELEFCGPVCCG